MQTLDCAGKHQVLIFVHSRKETAKTARYLKEEALKEDRLAQFMKVLLPSEQMQLTAWRHLWSSPHISMGSCHSVHGKRQVQAGVQAANACGKQLGACPSRSGEKLH